MEITNLKTLEKEAKRVSEAVEDTERQLRDLQVKRSLIPEEDALERCEVRIARLTYWLHREKEVLAEAETRLRQVRFDFQVYAQKNTFSSLQLRVALDPS